jgi:hypothetical protein
MQRKQSYVSTKLWYLFDSKLYSTSAKSETSIPPLIEVDSLLISWGLLSGHYQNDGTIHTTKWSRFHQLFTIVFMWVMLIRSVLCIFLDENSIWIQYIGDFSITLNDMMPRIFFQVVILNSSIKSAIMAIYFYMKEESDKLSWLKIMQLCKGLNTKYFKFITKI